jgi:outer membrane protein TolC
MSIGPTVNPARCAIRAALFGSIVAVTAAALPSCKSAEGYRKEADQVATDIIKKKQEQALGRTEPFTLETPADTLRRRLLGEQNLPTAGPETVGSDQLTKPAKWPEKDYPRRQTNNPDPVPPWANGQPLRLTLLDCLQIAARNSRDYQTQKEAVFKAALDLDLEIDEFRNTYTGLLSSLLSDDFSTTPNTAGDVTSATLGASRKLESGGILAGRLIFDLTKLLTKDKQSSYGIFADASVTIPLMRGAGREIVLEPMTQAERNVLYAMWNFETFKRSYAVRVATEYFTVLQQRDQVANNAKNYESLIRSTRRVRRLSDAGRQTAVQVDQALQQELSSRASWVNIQQTYQRTMDRFKITLGLPTDANIELDGAELERLREKSRLVLGRMPELSQAQKEMAADAPVTLEPPARKGGPYEIESERAIRIALDNRLDMRVRKGRVFDAQRQIVVAANALEAGLSLTGDIHTGGRRNTLGLASSPSNYLALADSFMSTGVSIDLPWERTGERNVYRSAYITLESAVRNAADLEDSIKFDVRDNLRQLLQAREQFKIQVQSEIVAVRRVDSANKFLDAGRANVSIRDLLEAQAALVTAQNAVTSAVVDYRVAELEMQRDMGILQVDEKGLWREYNPDELP